MVEILGHDVRTLGRVTQPAAEWIGDKSDTLMDEYVEPVIGERATEVIGKPGELVTGYFEWEEHPELWLIGGPMARGLATGGKFVAAGAVGTGAGVGRGLRALHLAGKGKKTASLSARKKAFTTGFKRGGQKVASQVSTLMNIGAAKRQTALNIFNKNLPSSRLFGKVQHLPKSKKREIGMFGSKVLEPGHQFAVSSRIPIIGTPIRKLARLKEDILIGTAIGRIDPIKAGPITIDPQSQFDKRFGRKSLAYEAVWTKAAQPDAKPTQSRGSSPTHSQSTTATPRKARVEHTTSFMSFDEGKSRSESQSWAASKKQDDNSYYGKKKKKIEFRVLRL